MSTGLERLKHIVVLMMSGRSFDHMLGGLSLVIEDGQRKYPRINGLTGNESNPDPTGNIIQVQPNAQFQGQLVPEPDHHFPAVDLQIFGGAPPAPDRVATMNGFVKDYFSQANDASRSHNIMCYFRPENLPVLTTLATEFAIFNGWFSSIPGPTIPNRAFAHYGTSFGQVDFNLFNTLDPLPSIYERMIMAGRTAKIYYYDQQSSILATASLMRKLPRLFSTYVEFIVDCKAGTLPEYSFIEPNHNDRLGQDGSVVLASDQIPDHNVREGERFIANTYNAIRLNPKLWASTLLLIVYDDHGGIYDHVAPPPCTPDGYIAPANLTGTGYPFAFDRLGVRVPAVLISPYIQRGTVVPGTEDPSSAQIFEHASIPGTATEFFLRGKANCTVREEHARSFLGLVTDTMRPDEDCVVFGNL